MTSSVSGKSTGFDIADLVVSECDSRKKSGARTNSSFVWKYFGALHCRLKTTDDLQIVDNEKWYCRYSGVTSLYVCNVIE